MASLGGIIMGCYIPPTRYFSQSCLVTMTVLTGQLIRIMDHYIDNDDRADRPIHNQVAQIILAESLNIEQ